MSCAFPAIAEEDESWALDSELGQYLFTRQRGEALHPERQPPAILDQIRRTIGEYNFAGQYQQAPSPQGGGMVKAAWFKNYAANERPDKFDQIVQSWDTANKASELSDFSVCTSWGVKGKGPLSLTRAAPAHGVSGAKARGLRAMRGVRSGRGADRR